MKKILLGTALLLSFNAFSTKGLTVCSTEELTSRGLPVFTFQVHKGQDRIVMRVTDRNISHLPKVYVCDESSPEEDLFSYSCTGGGYGEEKQVAAFIDKNAQRGNFFDGEDENKDYENLACDP